jgi:undecaprenyl-diphosphatase
MALHVPAVPRSVLTAQDRRSRLSARTGAIALGGLFLALFAQVLLGLTHGFDVGVLRAVQRVDLPHLTDVLRPIDWLTSSEGAVLMWGLLILVFALSRWWVPALMLLTLPVGGLINESFGILAGRSRPTAADVDRVIGHTDAPSFPSGHVAGAVMLYGLLFFIADRIGYRPLRLAVKIVSVAIPVSMGFARMWYGAHWPTDVLGAYALGGTVLIVLATVYRRLDAAVGRLPLIRAAELPHDHEQPHAHALTSLVTFNGDTVAKVYAPGLLPRTLYWLAFQAPFPYIRNVAALRAALYRRNLAGLLTEYWYGDNRVARATGIERTESGYALISEYVAGHAPRDRAAARAFLVDLRRRFEEAGLPTWQIDPRQPRAVDNLLESAAGSYHVVDLESGLVTPIASRSTWRQALRRGLTPMYDDVFFDITRAYLAREAWAMRAALGEEKFGRLQANLNAAELATATWHRGEPRLWCRLLRGLQSGFGITTWRARLAGRFAGSQEKAHEWIARAIQIWEYEGRVTTAEADAMRAHMNGAEFQAMLPHLGAHIVISILLRFPIGSIARAGWSIGALGTATVRLLLRRTDRKAWKQAWSIHSPLVIVLSAIPGFGTFAYLAAKPVRSNRLLLRATADALLRKLPWRLYRRSRLDRLIARNATQLDVAAAGSTDGRRPIRVVPARSDWEQRELDLDDTAMPASAA